MTTVIEDRAVDGPHGAVPVRVYVPEAPSGTGLVWMHGGAFCRGDLDLPEADGVSRQLAGAGITTVSVDYRLAVDGVHFPVPGDDVLAVWSAVNSGGGLGLGVRRWHIGGGSAGGNLAASTSMQARDGLAPLPASMVLVYPVLHDVLPPASAELSAKVAALPPEARFPPEESRRLNLNYVGDDALLTHPYAFPGHGRLDGLPPTLIINSDLDDLRSSGEAFGAALAASGVDVTVVREVGVRHGHLNEITEPGARRTIDRMIAWLRHDDLLGEAHETAPGTTSTPSGVLTAAGSTRA